MTSVFSWQNSISLCPASFCIPRPNLPITPSISWLPTFVFQSPIMKSTSFLGVSSRICSILADFSVGLTWSCRSFEAISQFWNVLSRSVLHLSVSWILFNSSQWYSIVYCEKYLHIKLHLVVYTFMLFSMLYFIFYVLLLSQRSKVNFHIKLALINFW